MPSCLWPEAPDDPHPLSVHRTENQRSRLILAGLAQLEAGLISERTKAALAHAKERGSKLGGDRGHRHTAEEARSFGALGGQRRSEMADAAALAASDLLAEVRERLGGDSASLEAVAREMNALGAKTPRGGQWPATAVKRASERIVNAARRAASGPPSQQNRLAIGQDLPLLDQPAPVRQHG